MRLTEADLVGLAAVAVDAATEAGALIAGSRPTEVTRKASGASLASQIVTEIDRQAEAAIIERLRPATRHFALGLLTEERVDDGSRHHDDHFWCVDPLDGTLPFVEGRPGSAVSIALVRRDGHPLVGVVYDISGARVVHAIDGVGAFIDGAPLIAPPDTTRLTVYGDRSLLRGRDADRRSAALDELADRFGLEGVDVHLGAGGVMNALGAVLAPPGCYLRFPGPAGSHSWDLAATTCVAIAAGAIAADVTGAPFELNRADSTDANHRGVLYATDASLADALTELVRRLC